MALTVAGVGLPLWLLLSAVTGLRLGRWLAAVEARALALHSGVGINPDLPTNPPFVGRAEARQVAP